MSIYTPITNETHDRPDTEAAWVKIPGTSPYEPNALRKMTEDELDKLEERIESAREKIEEAREAKQTIKTVPRAGTRVMLTQSRMFGTVVPKTALPQVGSVAVFCVLYDNGAQSGYMVPCRHLQVVTP